ncbi:INO80 complex subunit 4 [Cladobotryum mycophilum]|uniref:INO80 complex subunit 4 n=1 Tax=Cladobotryum mycophilum TaxID=491253 RepID=A0ABR0SKK0_9HYPO
MAPSSKAADGRRKSGAKPTLTITLKVSPTQLREIFPSASGDERSPTQESKDVKETVDINESPATPSALVASNITNSNGDNASDSNAATPAAEGTPAPSVMGPPTEGVKKKGVKRSAAVANGTIDGIPKPRGKPGPKKKPRLEDGTIDHASAANRAAGIHKLGPKANQGAINAGLRALDRSGKPCRRWAKGGFTLKSFTGVIWEIPRWTAPPRKNPDSSTEDSAVPSAESSNKENKENGNEGNSVTNSNSGADVEMHSVLSIQASSPAPIAVAAAS